LCVCPFTLNEIGISCGVPIFQVPRQLCTFVRIPLMTAASLPLPHDNLELNGTMRGREIPERYGATRRIVKDSVWSNRRVTFFNSSLGMRFVPRIATRLKTRHVIT
jgi:hypothetical protein